jgi:restriction system protein
MVLIDGEQLSSYIIDLDIGVSKVASYEIKRIGSDYFTEE